MRFDMVSICSAGAINREDLRAVRLVIVRFTVAMATGDPLALTAALMAMAIAKRSSRLVLFTGLSLDGGGAYGLVWEAVSGKTR